MEKLVKKLQQNKKQRKVRARANIFGTSEKPRLSVFKSNRGIYVQLIDDMNGKTLASVNIKELPKSAKFDMSIAAGKLIAKKAKDINITQAVFDRGINKYHGRVKAIAEAAREEGLNI